MKKLICSLVVAISLAVAVAEDIRIPMAYAMRRHGDDGSVYVIKVFEPQHIDEDGYTIEDRWVEWYVIQDPKDPNTFYGYEDDVRIVVTKLVDKSTKEY